MTKPFDFATEIRAFNQMYGLPVADQPSTQLVIAQELPKIRAQIEMGILPEYSHALQSRLDNLRKILHEEVSEVNDMLLSLGIGYRHHKGVQVSPATEYTIVDLLTDLADWLGDIQVYCASEMAKFGLPLNDVLRIIMASNFSKLGEDGKPLYDNRGKVMKGPGYWKPEPQIKALIEELINAAHPVQENEIVWRE